jgi:hypothetical protein
VSRTRPVGHAQVERHAEQRDLDLREIGLEGVALRELVELSGHGVSPSAPRRLAEPRAVGQSYLSEGFMG